MADVILWSVPTDANPADVRLRDPGSFSTGVTAAIAWTEADDAFSIAGTLTINAAAAWTEADDAYALSANLGVAAALAWVEADDAFALAGTLRVTTALSWTESDDAWAITGEIASPAIEASIAWTEESDSWSVVGVIASAQVIAGGGIKKSREIEEDEARRDAQLQNMLAQMRMRIAIDRARHQRLLEEDEHLMLM